jgi:UTP--glucose-1-phosphate uridylyltransferase
VDRLSHPFPMERLFTIAMNRNSMKAVIPAAGWGTRFLPATKSQPKEMLPVVDKPTIQYVVEEAVGSGIDDIIIITGRWKRAIEDHFDMSAELEHFLAEKGKDHLVREMQRISRMAEIHYTRQKQQKGLADAIYCAKKHVQDGPFAVLLGDDIIASKVPCIRQLMDVHERNGGAPVVALERHSGPEISRYGVIDGEKVSERTYRVRSMVEKPPRDGAPSDLAVMGRYVLTPDIFDHIERLEPGVGGELQITDAISSLASSTTVLGLEYKGKRYDIGSKLDWIVATIELALAREDMSKDLRAYLRQVCKDL